MHCIIFSDRCKLNFDAQAGRWVCTMRNLSVHLIKLTRALLFNKFIIEIKKSLTPTASNYHTMVLKAESKMFEIREIEKTKQGNQLKQNL